MSRLLLAAPLLLALGCSGTPAREIPLTVLGRSDHCGLDLSWQRIRSSDEIPDALPQVDIPGDSTTLVISMGTRPTGGFRIVLPDGATREGADARLDVRLDAPPPDAMVTQALTSPCVLVRLALAPETPLRVHFSGTAAELRNPPRE